MADIVVNTYDLLMYAERLCHAESKITGLEERIRILYNNVGWAELYRVLTSDELGWNRRKLQNCRDYIKNTVQNFENVETLLSKIDPMQFQTSGAAALIEETNSVSDDATNTVVFSNEIKAAVNPVNNTVPAAAGVAAAAIATGKAVNPANSSVSAAGGVVTSTAIATEKTVNPANSPVTAAGGIVTSSTTTGKTPLDKKITNIVAPIVSAAIGGPAITAAASILGKINPQQKAQWEDAEKKLYEDIEPNRTIKDQKDLWSMQNLEDESWYSKQVTILEKKKEIKEEVSALEYSASGENSWAKGEGNVKIGTAEAHANFSAGLYVYEKDVNGNTKRIFSPGVSAEVGVSVSAVELTGEGRIGLGKDKNMLGVYGGGEVKALSAEVKAGVAINKDEVHVGASAEADLVKVSGRAGVSVLGTDVGVSGSLKVGVGAHLDVGYTNGKFKFDVGAAIGVGVDVGFEVDVSGTVNAVCDKATSIFNKVDNATGGALTKTVKAVSDKATSIFNKVDGATGGALTKTAKTVSNAVSSISDMTAGIAKSMTTSTVNAIKGTATSAVNMAKNVTNAVVDAAKKNAVVVSAAKKVTAAVSTAQKATTAVVNTVQKASSAAVSTAKKATTAAVNTVQKASSSAVSTAKKATTAAVSTAKKATTTAVNTAKKATTTAVSTVKKASTATYKAVTSKISSSAKSATSTAKKIFKSIFK